MSESTSISAAASSSSALVTLAPDANGVSVSIETRWVNASADSADFAVFLHEGLGSVSMWRDWPQKMCERLGMRGLVYSRPGYGQSTPRAKDEKWPVDFMTPQARDVLPALLDALGIDAAARRRMWVIGHSDGGSIALLYAALLPDALAGAVAIAPHVFVEDLSVSSIAEAKVAYESGDLRARLARHHADVDSAFYGWNDIWLDPAFRHWRIDDAIRPIRAPLLAVQGHDDHYGTMAQIDTIAEKVPHTQLVKLDACGHSPHRDAPEALTDAIAAFVEANRDSKRS
jgi:pimeloyl-ACP methyl ester carboxylesterase